MSSGRKKIREGVDYLKAKIDGEEAPAIHAEFVVGDKSKCDIHSGENYFIGDLHEYHIHFENERVYADVELTGTLLSWRPETGFWVFGDEGNYWSWLPAVPEGTVKADIVIDGEKFHLTGHGYHDHNWCNTSMVEILHDWYWGRAKIGDYSLISAYISAENTSAYSRNRI